jgi:hypothetical protein
MLTGRRFGCRVGRWGEEMPGDKYRSIKGGKKGQEQYEAMRREGVPKSIAAATVNKRAKKG